MIQPVVNTVIFTVVFGMLVGIPSDGVPYPLFALCGMVVWTYFSGALRDAVDSLTGYTAMLTKIYFPRVILPLSSVLGKLVDLSVVFTLLIPMMLWYGVVPRIEAIVVVPFLILILVLTTLGLLCGCRLSPSSIEMSPTHSLLRSRRSCTCRRSFILTASCPSGSAFSTA